MITITGVGPTPSSFPYTSGHSASGRITSLVLAPTQGRLYAGSFAGVWRSDDRGQNWYQLTWPQPAGDAPQGVVPGALFAPHIYDLAVSPINQDVLLVSAIDSQFLDGRDGIYRTADGGLSWTLVLSCTAACNIVFAPDDFSLVYVAMGNAIGISRDAGLTWNLVSIDPAWHVAVGPQEDGGVRRVYAAGDSTIWFSFDGGLNWLRDSGVATINTARQALNTLRLTCDPNDMGIGGFAGGIAYAGGTAGRILAVEPGNPSRVFLATDGAANGLSFYNPAVPDGTPCNTVCQRLAGEASLWIGDFSLFNPVSPGGKWTQLSGPPVYFGGTSPSGNCFVVTATTPGGFLLFFSDNSHVHVSAGEPTATTSWHRLDGQDASVAFQQGKHSNAVFVHPDPHAIAFTFDFDIVIEPANGIPYPYNQNSVLAQHLHGTMWMANDGGVYRCENGGVDEQSWTIANGLETLDPVNLAGLRGLGNQPALYFGSGDNNDFFSLDGGATWGDPGSGCGDCDAWFADPATADRVILFLPRQPPPDGNSAGSIGLITSGDSSRYPNAASDHRTLIPSTQRISFDPVKHLVPYASSGLVLRGYRPLINTLATEAHLPDGDYVFIDQALDTGVSTLLRTTAISSIKTFTDWADPSKASAIGPSLPSGVDIVQVAGGHNAPIFYVGDAFGNVYRLGPSRSDATVKSWNQIVPANVLFGVSVQAALRWFVEPYDPNTIYILDTNGIKVSSDGGQGWVVDPGLTAAITAGGLLAISPSLLQDMQFSRGEDQTRFAMGTAGVFCTMDSGVTWFPILNSIALPGRPESGFFDPLSNPTDRAFYVECEGRSVLRIGGLPQLPPFQPPPPPIDLMAVAATVD